jgi:hypothetical protein
MVEAGNSHVLRTISALIAVCLVGLPAYAQYAGGTGTPENPFQIATADDLADLSDAESDWDKHFVLLNDIDLDPNLPDGQVFERAVIAPDTGPESTKWWDFSGTPFSGTFDGNGFAIRNLTIAGEHHLGLFGEIAETAEVRALGVVNIRIAGTGGHIGGLAGHSLGRVISCYSTGTVSGQNEVGGLVGWNGWGTVWHNRSTVTNSYSSCTVSGESRVGGLVGHNYGSVIRSYSTGAVSGVEAGWSVGGLVGENAGNVYGSMWDVETSGQSAREGIPRSAEGMSTAEMQDINTYLNAGWDFVGETQNGFHKVWQMPEGGGYPVLRAFTGYTPSRPQLPGQGTPEDPYLISSALELAAVDYEPGASYRLTASIDLSDISWSMAVIPEFSGTFDGNGFVVHGLRITGIHCLGLFGTLASGAEVHDLGMTDAHVAGLRSAYAVGTLVGKNFGVIAHCHSVGTVSSDWYSERVGGLAGDNAGLMTDCHSEAAVSCDVDGRIVGGLAGSNGGSMFDCHSAATVSCRAGVMSAGGLLGSNGGSVTRCYSVSTVRGADEVTGGLIGDNDGIVTHCWSDVSVYGDYFVGGLVGRGGGSVTNCRSIGTVDGTCYVGGLMGRGGTIRSSYSTCVVSGLRDVGGLLGTGDGGAVTNCHSMGVVEGRENIGGLAGAIDDTRVTNCYSTGPVYGDDSAGGLVGYNRGSVRDSFWDMGTSGLSESDGGSGLTTARMKEIDTYLMAGWDFVDEAYNGTEDIWWLPTGQAYPRLWWENIPDEPAACELADWLNGEGTQDHPYLIYTAEELNAVGLFECDWDKHFRLMADIDLNDHVAGPFNVIGKWARPFTGVFDGNGHTISNFIHECSEGNYIGLFGQIRDPNAAIKNLGLIDPVVDAGEASNVGSLVGCLEDGTVTRCYTEGGTILGKDHVGGLVGSNAGGHVTQCYGSGTVTGITNVGGLVGGNSSRVLQCYSTGVVGGSESVGGLVGKNEGTITDCYASVNVTGDKSVAGLAGDNLGVVTNCCAIGTVAGTYYAYVGGLVGFMSEGDTVGSFWDVETCGLQKSGGGEGKTTAEMQTASTFLAVGWDFIDEAANGTEDIWWILEGRGYPRLWWERSDETSP